MESNTFKLSSPITTHKGQLAELTLNPATAHSFMTHGSPYSISKDEVITPHWSAVFGFLSDMTGVDTLLLSAIPGTDVMPLFYKLVNLLNARPTTGLPQSEGSSSA